MGTFQSLVKRATKIKMAPPKEKYLRPIVMSTGEVDSFQDIMQALLLRVGDSAFTVVFKALVVLHVMVREGEKNVTLEYLARHEEFFELPGLSFNSSPTSSAGIQLVKRYNNYLKTRAEEYGEIGRDYVRDGASNLKSIERNSVVLKHVESLEFQITALLKNRFSQYDLNNGMLMAAFKLLVQDVLVLYNALNEGIITLLESFFELSRPDAKRTLELYKRFVHLTETVVKYLKAGKAVGLEIPVIKHITTKLIRSLEDHLREGENQSGDSGQKSQGAPISESQRKSDAQKQLELVREQKRILQEQLQLTNPLVQQLTQQPRMQPAATGYNPFLDLSQTAQHQNNPFITQPIVSQTTAFVPQPIPAVIAQPATIGAIPQAVPQQMPSNPFAVPTLGIQQPLNQPVNLQQTNPFANNQLHQQPIQGPIVSYATGYIPQQQQPNQNAQHPPSMYLNQGPNLIDI
ncbi:HDL427Wp [Eremothecium sinecaudum]|uniref:HDL427Wp n=1 Tax=Eremothecium sinecaudum TaxID=45286 RepID=A0A0X8HRT4_9SACH|nr:HDL427Wp [Eremothecium sinecaudum]AMD20317.1 HDL427Wp [Eremothecium sinecaudum]